MIFLLSSGGRRGVPSVAGRSRTREERATARSLTADWGCHIVACWCRLCLGKFLNDVANDGQEVEGWASFIVSPHWSPDLMGKRATATPHIWQIGGGVGGDARRATSDNRGRPRRGGGGAAAAEPCPAAGPLSTPQGSLG